MEMNKIEALLVMYVENEVSFITSSCPVGRTNSPGGKAALCYATSLYQFSGSDIISFKCNHCRCISRRVKEDKGRITVDCDVSPKIITSSKE